MNRKPMQRFGYMLLALVISLLAPCGWQYRAALAGVTDIAPSPIFTSTTATTEVKPNVMFVLDDSGSMDWTYMPDDANNFAGQPGYASSQCNGVYYNPAITYSLPVNSVGSAYSNATFTSAWINGYKTSSGTTDLGTSFKPSSSSTSEPAYYYTYSGTQTADRQKDYETKSSIFYRECSNGGASITVNVSSSTSVSSITVNGNEILSTSTSSSSTSSTVADRIRSNINNCTNWVTGNCQVAGYSASRTGNVLTITAPANAGNITYTPVVTSSPTATTTTFLVAPFTGSAMFTKVVVPASEKQNFANWYSYYRTRMLMMKTATGQAFQTLDAHFRIGFMTINGSSSSEFLNISDFSSGQKADWYTKLYAVAPNSSTPLREALAYSGQIFAGKKPSSFTNNGITITDPVQYSCQQNYTILSTDGFWNGTDANVKKLDGATMDNQDGSLPRPYNDGFGTTFSKTTSQFQSSQTQVLQNSTQPQKRVTQRQSRTTEIKTRTQQIIKRVRQLQKKTVQYRKCRANGSNCSNINFDCTGDTGDSSKPLCKSTIADWVNSSSCTATTGNASPFIYCQTTDTGEVNASSCTASGPTSGRTITCPNTDTTENTNSCTASGPTNGLTISCPNTDTGFVNTGTCTASGPTNGQTVSCQTTDTGWLGASSCTASPLDVNGMTTTCQINNTSASPVASCSCTASAGGTCTTAAASGNNWTQTTCSNTIINTGVGVPACTASIPTAVNNFTTTSCATATTGPTSSSTCIAETASASNNYTATTCSAASNTGGTSNTLADVAAHYYNTNLRTTELANCTGPVIAPATTATDLCAVNKVPPNGMDTATWQHMTTFTLGLGVRGRMVFSPTYLTDTSGDYYDVWKGNTATSNRCTWASSGSTCDWPTPAQDQLENIDDLWHAAVNGHGNYFGATDPTTLKNALSSSLNVIINTPQPGTAASAATSNPKITSANNFQFSSYFKSVEWSGELIKQTMSLLDGSVAAYDPLNPVETAYDWSAQTLLDAKTYTNRNIYTKGSSGLIPFTWTDLGAALQANFKTPNISTAPPAYPSQLTGLAQFCTAGADCISSTAQSNFTVATGGAAGEALVNYLRGDRSNEEGTVTDASKYFRHRAHVLGDIVSAQPQYVGPPNKTYTDSGYAAFKAAQASRTAVVFAAANDGMLHAFNAETGEENWAYIPSFVLPRLYTLADKNYANKHQYFVEGTPKSGDALISGSWKTILVGGLNGGGTGYYALDITNPAVPVLLWEFTDANMGYTFGNPEITKLDDGTWVVLVTSGYNNCARTTSSSCVTTAGNGNGYLYVLNASTGALISSISTALSGPSGLSRIISKADAQNVAKLVYGGDLLGNLWRFTIETTGASSYTKQLLASFKDAAGDPQPITARPQVTTFNGTPVVFVGTGRYLGTTDVGTTQQQSFYGVKDNVVSTAYTSIRSDSTFIKKTAIDGTCPTGTAVEICDTGTKVRTVSLNTGTLATDSITTKNGWFVDFPANSNELEFTDPKLVLGTLAFSTSVPVASTSVVCGDPSYPQLPAFAYMLNYLTGGAVGATDVIANTLGIGIATAPQIAQLPDGKVIGKFRLSSGQEISVKQRYSASAGANITKRVSWRELVTE